jgi:hypothetical protein
MRAKAELKALEGEVSATIYPHQEQACGSPPSLVLNSELSQSAARLGLNGAGAVKL